ncbi:uncharacterized protein ISCGN_010908 [Ixodes scapularis]
MDLSSNSLSRAASFGSQESLTNSGSSASYFNFDETELDFLWSEGIEVEDVACFSFERVDQLDRNREALVSFREKVELWQYAQEIRKQRSQWVRNSLLSPEELDDLYGLGDRLESACPDDVPDVSLPAKVSVDSESSARTSPVGNTDTPAPWRLCTPASSLQGRVSFWKRVRQVFEPKHPLTRERNFRRRAMSFPIASPLVR